MTQEMQRCPNCGAYVMSNDDICPRCDQRLDAPAPTEEPAAENVDLRNLPTVLEMGQVDREAGRAPELDPVEAGERPEAESEPVEPESAPELISEPEVESESVSELEAVPEAISELETAPRSASERETVPEAEVAPESISASEAAPVSSAAVTTARHTTGEPPADEEDTSEVLVLDDPLDMTHPAVRFQSEATVGIPPAPYTPPPPVIVPPYIPPGYDPYLRPPSAQTQAAEFIQHRVDLYRHGGYRLRSNRPDEAILTCGKRLSVGGWVVALISLVGLFWYLLLLVLSGFQADAVYIVLESDGFIYEDGPGAAHTRRHRTAVGRRWAVFGLILVVVSLVLGIALGVAAGTVLTQERYQAALREAYPAVTLFEEQFSDVQATPDDVTLAKNGAVAFAILAGMAGVGLWGGLTLLVIGTIHAGAYRVDVPPLPGWG